MSYRLTALNPVADPVRVSGKAASRPESLAGKRLGLWWNTKSGGDVALTRIADQLKARYKDVEVEWFSEHYPASKETLRACRERSDVVVGSTGD